MTLDVYGPSAAVSPIASRIAGTAISASITRISSASNFRYCAESTPRKAPNTPEISAVARPIHSESLAP